MERLHPERETAAPLPVACVGKARGGEAWLLEGGQGALLFEAGFGFCAPGLVGAVEKRCPGRAPQAILLSRSHYDHALGSGYCRSAWPETRVAASALCGQIFARPGARAVMEELDESAALQAHCPPRPGAARGLGVDLPMEDGARLELAGVELQALAMPGHTRCSMSYFLPQYGLLLSSETLGVWSGTGTRVLPTCLVGGEMTFASIRKARALGAEALLLPHGGVIRGAECGVFLREGELAVEEAIERVLAARRAGKSRGEILACYRTWFYPPSAREAQPEKAFLLNAGYTIRMILREFGGEEEAET